MAGLVPKTWMPDAAAKRIICHWTGGGPKASDLEKKDYHIIIQRDGELVRGDHTITDNDSTADGNYAAHTGEKNTGSIGVSLCGMLNAEQQPFKPGPNPIVKRQWNILCQVCAELCFRYGIEVAPDTVLMHSEVKKRFHTKGNGTKWDISVWPWSPETTADEVYHALRVEVADRLKKWRDAQG